MIDAQRPKINEPLKRPGYKGSLLLMGIVGLFIAVNRGGTEHIRTAYQLHDNNTRFHEVPEGMGIVEDTVDRKSMLQVNNDGKIIFNENWENLANLEKYKGEEYANEVKYELKLFADAANGDLSDYQGYIQPVFSKPGATLTSAQGMLPRDIAFAAYDNLNKLVDTTESLSDVRKEEIKKEFYISSLFYESFRRNYISEHIWEEPPTFGFANEEGHLEFETKAELEDYREQLRNYLEVASFDKVYRIEASSYHTKIYKGLDAQASNDARGPINVVRDRREREGESVQNIPEYFNMMPPTIADLSEEEIARREMIREFVTRYKLNPDLIEKAINSDLIIVPDNEGLDCMKDNVLGCFTRHDGHPAIMTTTLEVPFVGTATNEHVDVHEIAHFAMSLYENDIVEDNEYGIPLEKDELLIYRVLEHSVDEQMAKEYPDYVRTIRKLLYGEGPLFVGTHYKNLMRGFVLEYAQTHPDVDPFMSESEFFQLHLPNASLKEKLEIFEQFKKFENYTTMQIGPDGRSIINEFYADFVTSVKQLDYAYPEVHDDAISWTLDLSQLTGSKTYEFHPRLGAANVVAGIIGGSVGVAIALEQITYEAKRRKRRSHRKTEPILK